MVFSAVLVGLKLNLGIFSCNRPGFELLYDVQGGEPEQS